MQFADTEIDMAFWEGKKVVVTGGIGFIGGHLVEALVSSGAKVTAVSANGSAANFAAVKKKIKLVKGNLFDLNFCKTATKNADIVMNLAAKVGGVAYNIEHHASMLRDNVLLGMNVLEAARKNNVERFLAVSSACVYSKNCSIPTPETEGFAGMPEETNFGYGWGKRISELAAIAYAKEYGMSVAIVRPYNTYGPWDHFGGKRSHVIPALIARIFSGENPLNVWGSGEQSRSFIYVKDVVEGMMLATEKYCIADPLNLGTNEEVKIKTLIQMICEISGKSPKIVFDTSKPSGQPRRNCDISKAKEKIGFIAKTSLAHGLRETIEWYKQNH